MRCFPSLAIRVDRRFPSFHRTYLNTKFVCLKSALIRYTESELTYVTSVDQPGKEYNFKGSSRLPAMPRMTPCFHNRLRLHRHVCICRQALDSTTRSRRSWLCKVQRHINIYSETRCVTRRYICIRCCIGNGI